MNIQQQIREEIEDCLDYENYSSFTELSVQKDQDYDDEYEVSLKFNDIKFNFRARKNENKFEINMYEDNWEEFNSYSWQGRSLWFRLFVDATDEIFRLKRKLEN